MVKSRKLANTKMKGGSLLIDEGYDLHRTPCFTTRVSCLQREHLASGLFSLLNGIDNIWE